jgi:maltose/moltooligosaccharide transporter
VQEQPVADDVPIAKDPDRFKAGTLTYTKAGLLTLFLWLLWGDVCVTILSAASSGVATLAFKRHGAPNWLMGLLLATIPGLLNFTFNPIISTASDRTRTRWGRRIPYLAFTAPIAGALMIVMGLSEDLGLNLARLAHWNPEITIVVALALCYTLFSFTDLFVGTVYYYLFNDVVPRPYFSRFAALFSAVGQLSGAFYGWYVYQYSEDHMKAILVSVGVLYMIGYTFMCFFVKEGKYPPPPAGMERRQGMVAMAKLYLKECFCHRFYWIFYLANAAMPAAFACGFATVFLNRDSLGLSLSQIGKVGAVASLATAALLYPAGIIADRVHPLSFMRFTMVLQTTLSFVSLNWLFWNPSPHTALIIYITYWVMAVPLGAMHRASAGPMVMHMLPQERYGQFCAAAAMVSSLVLAVLGVIAGVYLDVMKWLYSDVFAGAFLNRMKWLYENSDFGYRFIPVWQVAFMCFATWTLFLLHREWVRLGGKKHYRPPSADVPDSEQKPPAEAANGADEKAQA